MQITVGVGQLMTPLMSTLPFPSMGAVGTMVLVGVAPHVWDSTDLVEVLDEGMVRHVIRQVLMGVGCGIGLMWDCWLSKREVTAATIQPPTRSQQSCPGQFYFTD